MLYVVFFLNFVFKINIFYDIELGNCVLWFKRVKCLNGINDSIINVFIDMYVNV